MICVALIAASFCLVGCSDDGDNNGTVITGGQDTANNNDNNDNNGNDTGDVGGDDGDAAPLDAGDDDGGGTDADAAPDAEDPITDLCNGLEPLGVLPGASTINASGNTADGTQLVDPTCGTSGNKEVVFEFSVDQPMRINLEIQSQDTDDWILALYQGSCDAPSRIKCKSSRADVFIAEVGKTYYLSVEAATANTDAAFSLALQTNRLNCAPLGSTTCDGTTAVTHCESGGMDEVTYQCPYDCASGACGGDICANAIEIANSGTHNFSGSYSSYTSEFNFQGRGDCSNSEVGVNSPGQDLVFSLPGLTAGQQIVVDASADGFQNGIFIMRGCSAQEACLEGGLQVNQSLEWSAPDAGDYHVVIDLIDDADGDFDFTITR
jgi:hypothetical protein